MKKNTIIVAVSITVLGIALRLHNLSQYMIYPDSYQVLLVAQNIQTYHSVVGQLGINGMAYPDFFAWTRSGYSLLTLFVSIFLPNLSIAARYTSLIASIVSLSLAFVLGRMFFKSKTYGLAVLLLLSLSFNHAVWGGFILTEGVAGMFMLLFLLSMIAKPPLSTKYPLPFAIGSGLLFGLLILTRYEYSLLVVPVSLYFLRSKKYAWSDLFCFMAAFIFMLALVGSLLYPLPASLFLLLSQSQDLLSRIGILLATIVLLVVIVRRLPSKVKLQQQKYIEWVALVLLWALPVLTLAIGRTLAPALRNFMLDDPLLVFFFLLGTTLLIHRKRYQEYVLFVFLSILLLFTVYYRTNPGMERYLTHLIPFILLPAGYGLVQMYTKILNKTVVARLALLILIFLISLQIYITYQGIRNWGDKTWYQESYDEKVAVRTSQLIHSKNALLLVSFPEPYFYYSRLSTYSITDTYPYIYIPNTLNMKELVISNDMGMHDQFPHFSHFLQTHMSSFKIASFRVQKPYHFGAYSRKEIYPVVLYKTTVLELKKQIRKAQKT